MNAAELPNRLQTKKKGINSKKIRKKKNPQIFFSGVFWSEPFQSLRLTLSHQLRVTPAKGQGWEVAEAAFASSAVHGACRNLVQKPRGSVI